MRGDGADGDGIEERGARSLVDPPPAGGLREAIGMGKGFGVGWRSWELAGPPLLLCSPPPDPGAFFFKAKSPCAKGTEEKCASHSGRGRGGGLRGGGSRGGGPPSSSGCRPV